MNENHHTPNRRKEMKKMSQIERTVDALGRVVLPQEFRSKLGITEKSRVVMREENGVITITAAQPMCRLCGSNDNVNEEVSLCSDCIERIKAI